MLTRRRLLAGLGGAALVGGTYGLTRLITTDEPATTPTAGPPTSVEGADGQFEMQLSGPVNATLIPAGVSAVITGDLELRGDLVVEGFLTGVDTFRIDGNGHQIEVMSGGQIDWRGKPKTGWYRDSVPEGWEDGDRVVTLPVAVGEYGDGEFDTGRWPLDPSPSMDLIDGRRLAAERFNLDRSIVIDSVSRLMFHMGAGRQVLQHIAVRNAGRTDELGFYPIHFHLNGEASRGSIVEGVIVENGQNHAFVPHASHGIEFRDCVAFNTTDTAFWWDDPEGETHTENNTNDTLWENCLVAGVVPSDDRGFRLSGFLLGAGRDNICVGSVAVGVQGQKDSSGFHWPESANDNEGGNIWTFEDCVSHNNRVHGIFTWQNDSGRHPISRFVAYRNGDSGIDHGAYVNVYRYEDLVLDQNENFGIQSHALGRGEPVIWSRVLSSTPLLVARHTLEGSPVIYREISVPSVVVDERSDNGDTPSTQIFEDCGLTPEHFEFRTIVSGTVIEIFEGGRLEWRWAGDWQSVG